MASRFPKEHAERYFLEQYPQCPEYHREELVKRLCNREWHKVKLPKAAGIVATTYIRHRLTDYEMLLREFKLTREEARICEAQTVNEIVSEWRAGALVKGT